MTHACRHCANRRAARCDGGGCSFVTGPAYTYDQCRPCWLRLGGDPGAPTRRAVPRGDVPPPPARPCVHLGGPTGGLADCPSCRRRDGGRAKTRMKLSACAVHGRCSPGGAAAGVIDCRSCRGEGLGYEPVTPLAAPVVRNLLYHLYPRRGSGWRWNVGELLKRAGLFNGRRVVAAVTDGTTDPPDAVRAALAPLAGEVIFLDNDPGLREVATFEALFSRAETLDPSHCTFYWHGKGVSRPRHPTVRKWVEMTFESCLDYWPYAELLLQHYPVAGPFLRHGGGVWADSKSVWHYSGSAFWFRNRDLFRKPDWARIDRFWSGIEPYPSLHFTAALAGCLFWEWHDPVGPDLYDPAYMAAVVAAYGEWRQRHEADYREWP